MKKHPQTPHTGKDTSKHHPILWNITEDKKKGFIPHVCYDCVHRTLEDMGFRTYWANEQDMEFIRVQNNILTKVTRNEILHSIYEEHIRWTDDHETVDMETDEGKTIPVKAQSLREAWKRGKNNILSNDQIAELKAYTNPILKDTHDTAYFPFRNCIVKVVKKGKYIVQYEDLNEVGVWKSHITQRDYNQHDEPERCMFHDYIMNVAGQDPKRALSFMTGMGHLLHIYTSPAKAKAVISYDEAVNDGRSMNGGTGKGMFIEAASKLRNVTHIEGRSYSDKNIFQWDAITPETQIVWLEDPNEKFKFGSIFTQITKGLNIQRKYKGRLKKSREESPKWYIDTNYMLDDGDSSNDRRQHVLTFSGFYRSKLKEGTGQPIVDHHKCEFFTQWDDEEWKAFDNYMIDCVLLFMNEGLKSYTCSSVAISQIASRTSTTFFEWVQTAGIAAGCKFGDHELYMQYMKVTKDVNIDIRIFNQYLDVYAKYKGLKRDRIGAGGRTFIFKKVTE